MNFFHIKEYLNFWFRFREGTIKKNLVVFTSKAWPLPLGKALVIQNKFVQQLKIIKLLRSWPDPSWKITQ